MLDVIIVILLIVLIILCFILLLINTKDRKRNKTMLNKALKDRIDLEAITKNIEESYKPINIKLTSYEQEQEDNAIISYEELVDSAKNSVTYESNYTENGIDIKKVDLTNQSENEEHSPKIEVTLMSYEKEEAFLKALKQLQSTLVR